jgi:hypothetical protein
VPLNNKNMGIKKKRKMGKMGFFMESEENKGNRDGFATTAVGWP